MGNASDTSEFVLVNNDVALPNSRKLVVAPGLSKTDSGGGGDLTIAPAGILGSLQNLSSTGLLVRTATDTVATRELVSGVGIAITNGDGVAGEPVLNVLPDSNLQRVEVLLNGNSLSQRAYLNFIDAAGVGIAVLDDSGNNRTNITISSEVGADTDAPYLIKTPFAGLPNAQVMGGLATGIVKNTTITGIQTIAVSDVDYQSANQNLIEISAIDPVADGQLLTTTGGAFVSLPAGPNNTYLSMVAGNAAWQAIPGASNYVVMAVDFTAVPNVNYLITGGSLVTVTLPAVCPQGAVIKIAGFGAGGWVLAQQNLQQILFGDQQTSIGSGGGLSSTYFTDCVDVVCGVSNLTFTVVKPLGNVNFF